MPTLCTGKHFLVFNSLSCSACMGLTDLGTGFAFPCHRHGNRQHTANRILTILQFNYTITAVCFELFFLLIFNRYSAFPPVAAAARGGGMRTPSLVSASSRTQAHILLSPAWHALPLFKQPQGVLCLFCSDIGFLFSSAAFAPRFARIGFHGAAKVFWPRQLCPWASRLQVRLPG